MSGAGFGHQGRLVLATGDGTPADWSVNSRRWEFVACTLAKHGRHISAQGISGTRSPHVDRVRQGTYSVFGSIVLNVSPLDFDFLLPLAMGAGTNPNFSLAEDVPYFAAMFDTDEDVFLFTGLKVDTMIIRGSAARLNEQSDPDLITVELRCIGKTFEDDQTWPVAAPEIPRGANTQPYILSDAAITIDTTAREALSFAMVIRNFLQARFVNSLTATSICPANTRFVGARIRHPWNSTHSDLLEPDIDLGETATITFTNAAMSTQFTMGRVTAPNRPSPTITNKGEIFLERDYRAYAVGTVGVDYVEELAAVNDSAA